MSRFFARGPYILANYSGLYASYLVKISLFCQHVSIDSVFVVIKTFFIYR